MSKIPAYARFLELLYRLNKEEPDTDFDGCDEILAYIIVRDAAGDTIKITNLVQALQFGTGPTVHRKLSALLARGLIKISQSDSDARAKNLSITTAGLEFLKERSRLLKQCLEG